MALGSKWKSANRVRDGIDEKRCSVCEQWFAATPEHFHRHNHRLHSECKTCANKAAREYQRDRYVPGCRRVDRRPETPQNFDASALEQAMRRPV